MCSSSATELSLSHAGLRQDYKRWTAMCSKSSYLPSLEGMPCKMWLAVCSMPAIDFWRPFLLVLWAALGGRLAITCWFLHVPDLQPPPLVFCPTCLVTSSEAAKQAPSLWWHVHYIGHMADWLHAEGENRSQAARHCYYSRWGKRGIQYLDRCHLLLPPVWKLDIVQNELSV